jgi:hydrophobe/amphiphile efflux-1 (HAE1) family protein
MWLTRLALRNPILILMMSLMVLALGALSTTRLSVDLFPNIDIPVIRVATFYAGAGPEDIEKSITQPIERAVASSPGVDRVESTSKQGASIVSVWFNYGVNLDTAQFEVQQRVSQIQSTLPPGIQNPYILKFDVTNIPIVQVVIRGEGLDEKQLYDLTYNVIQPQLERLPGMASASVSGGKQREIEVKVDRDQLRARGLGILDVVNAVKGANLLLPSGNLRAGDTDYNVFTNTQVDTVRQLEGVVVRQGTLTSAGTMGQSTSSVRVGDLASVVDGTADQANVVRVNGTRGVYLRVFKQPGANTIAAVDAVRAALPNLRGVPPNVKVEISFDQSTYIRAAVSALEHEAVQGGLLAVAVILVFLVSFRATGIVAVAIPMSIIATFILLYFFGQTLNVFTLGGLALGVGRLVDDSIVELENIHRHLQFTENRRKAVLDAAQEVAMPILVSTITTVIVFFPVLFLAGVAKNLFLPLAMTITFALVMSFFVSRTVTPLLCLSWLRGVHQATGLSARITRGLDWIDQSYAAGLGVVLRHRAIVIGAILAVFVMSLGLLKLIGTEFFPDSDERQFSVIYKTPIGTRVERTELVAQRIEEIAKRELTDGTKVRFTTMLSDSGLPGGRTALFTTNTGPHAGNMQVNLVPKDERPYSDLQATERVRNALKSELPGVSVFYFTGGIVKRILNFGAPAPIDVEILGYDLDQAAAYAKQVAGKLRDVRDAKGQPLLTDVQISREENYPELDVVVDREKAGVLGVSEQQIAQTVLTSLVGNTQFSPIPFADPATGNAYFINVKLDDAFRSNVSDLSNIFLKTPAGQAMPLANLAHVERSSGPVQITRKYLQRIIDVTANVAPGKDLGAASDAAQQAVDSITAPDGFTVQLGGQTIAQKQAFQGLGLAVLMALALVYMVLASQFKSLLDPLVIMFSVPLGVSGVFATLAATKTTLSVNSAMGIIMMVGIVVSNGVLLVDFANVLRRRGIPLHEATVQAAKTRLRPILMTTIATVAGLIPMALGIGEGSETNLPLARSVIGGLTVSTFFTLFLIPSLYTLVDRFKKRKPHEEDDHDEEASGGGPTPGTETAHA